MDEAPLRILCVGKDQLHLECRCAVLAHNGYEAHAATLPCAYQRLRTENFNLVTLSTRLIAEHGNEFLNSLPVGTKILPLEGFVFPTELLTAVSQRLQAPVQPFAFAC